MLEQSTDTSPEVIGSGFDYRGVLRQMLEQNASDLHLKVGCAPTLRVDGELRSLPMPPLRSDDMKEAIAAFVEQRAPVYRGR